MTYTVKEIYYTLQGEGFHAGRPAVFLRFTGCNLWSGHEKDRASAVCPFCDPDFVGTDGPGGGKFPRPADLAAARGMKTTRVGGPHPDYVVRSDADPNNPDAPRAIYQQDLWHYSLSRMIDACTAEGILPYYGPFGDIEDIVGCEDQFRNAYLLGCVGGWTLHPNQIDVARRVFTPRAKEVLWAKRVLEVMAEGGAIMVDGKMQDEATLKQCEVVLDLAKLLAKREPELRKAYAFTDADLSD